jgi:short-subunit dehydrogenase
MKTAVVTGTSYGLGKSIAEMLLVNDFKVYGVSRTKSPIEDKNFVWIKTDLLDEKSYDLVYKTITENKIDMLINSAGTAFLIPALKYTDENFLKMFSLNFSSSIKLTSKMISKLDNGLIINISSVSDRYTDNNWGLYSASKAALNIYFDSVADGNKGVKIFNLLPDYMDTPLQHKLSDGTDFDWNQAMPPESVAQSVKYLIEHRSDLPSTARIIVVNNKLLMDTEDPEKLFYYNIDTKEFKKLK